MYIELRVQFSMDVPLQETFYDGFAQCRNNVTAFCLGQRHFLAGTGHKNTLLR